MSTQRKDGETPKGRFVHPDPTVRRLLARGFTTKQAVGLAEVSRNVNQSREAQESENVMDHLRFTRWLIEQNRIGEGKPRKMTKAYRTFFESVRGSTDSNPTES
ncbi:MAG TPA: hypothetical protein VEW42_03270 [Candidatus Eisenbacteria bacterium]|nr:hypothetical protein [Candidatus Eisenbacteria bacterium]